jgi:hypothetical protein
LNDPVERDEIGKMLIKRTAIEPIIEPIIGHLKSDHHLGRNMLHGVVGDGINAILSAAAFNLKKFVRLAEEKLTSVISDFFGKPKRRPKRKTNAVPFCKPLQTVRLFPKCAENTA